MFADRALARRIEAAEASLTYEVGRGMRDRDAVVVWLGDGVAVHAGDSPFDKVIGAGFDALDVAAFERFERIVRARGGQVQIELSTLADPAIASALAARGYALCGFENVLGRTLDPTLDFVANDSITEITPDEIAIWLDTVARGSVEPDELEGAAPHESFSIEAIGVALRDMGTVTGYRRFLARRPGEVVGGASMRIHDGVAQLGGAATLAPYRRRGVQTGLLRARLASAARAGCDLAVVTTQPGSRSQQNVMRAGFSLLYARAILRRP